MHQFEIFQVTGYYSCTQTSVTFSLQNQDCFVLKLWWQICTGPPDCYETKGIDYMKHRRIIAYCLLTD